MSKLTRNQIAAGVFAQLRALGPQTVAQIQDDLRITKREIEDALYVLTNRGHVEHAWPSTSPLVYQVTQEGRDYANVQQMRRHEGDSRDAP